MFGQLIFKEKCNIMFSMETEEKIRKWKYVINTFYITSKLYIISVTILSYAAIQQAQW